MTDEFFEGQLYRAPIHHRHLTSVPSGYGLSVPAEPVETEGVIEPAVTAVIAEPIASHIIAANGAVVLDQPEPPGVPHRLPPHPDPAHHRPVHVAGMAAARQMAEQPVMDYRGQPVVTHQVAPQPKKVSHWPAALTSAVLSAILASVGTAAWLTYHPGAVTPSVTAPIYNAPHQPTTPVAPGPVENSTATNPYWQGVAAAVGDSVVAIQASTGPGGGSVGSGFIIDEIGHVLTNNHVIAGATNDQVQVTLADGRLYHANIVGGDTFTDLAVILLQNPPSDLRPVSLGDSDTLYVGDPVLAIGNPLGLANTTTSGIISAINRPVTATGQDGLTETVTNAIQIDAAINPGNSGGPLFDHQGRVIGVTSSIASLSSSIFGGQPGSIGLGFAIPINLARSISSQIIETGTAEHPRLGVSLTSAPATADGISRRGARIESVVEGTAAAAAGLQVGDVVIGFNGLPVTGSDSLTGFVRERRVGDVVELTVIRDGQLVTVTATLGAMTDVPAAPIPEPELTLPPNEDDSTETEDEAWLDEYGNPQD